MVLMAQKTLSEVFGTAASKTTLSIVGTAGRKYDAKKMSRELYNTMVQRAEQVITEQLNLELSQIRLVSGGAAWADHVAVTLYLKSKVCALTLHLPAKWKKSNDKDKPGYEETSAKDNPGKTANKLHRHFSKELGYNTLEDIDKAFKCGAVCRVHDGFKQRNTAVANSNYLLAFTWNEGNVPKKGGTYDTWIKCSGKKVHISLQSLITSPPDSTKHQTVTELASPETTKHLVAAEVTCPNAFIPPGVSQNRGVSIHQSVTQETFPQHQTVIEVTCPNDSNPTVTQETSSSAFKHQPSSEENVDSAYSSGESLEPYMPEFLEAEDLTEQLSAATPTIVTCTSERVDKTPCVNVEPFPRSCLDSDEICKGVYERKRPGEQIPASDSDSELDDISDSGSEYEKQSQACKRGNAHRTHRYKQKSRTTKHKRTKFDKGELEFA